MNDREPTETPAPRRQTVDADAPNPVFLEHSGYRQRRLRDALRMLPVLGVVLWLLPLFLSGPEGGAPGNAAMLLYLFGVWIGLILLAWILSRNVRFDPGDAPRDGDRRS